MLSVASDAVQRTRADMKVHRQRCARVHQKAGTCVCRQAHTDTCAPLQVCMQTCTQTHSHPVLLPLLIRVQNRTSCSALKPSASCFLLSPVSIQDSAVSAFPSWLLPRAMAEEVLKLFSSYFSFSLCFSTSHVVSAQAEYLRFSSSFP